LLLGLAACTSAPVAQPQPPISLADWEPRAGDVILRASADLVGSRIGTASGERAIYSHVGLVVARDGRPQVIDISPYGSGRVEFTNLAAFTTDGEITDLLVLRPLSPLDTARLEAEAERLAAAGIKFDYSFDMADASELYCSELTYHLLRAAGVDVAAIPWTRMYVPLHGERDLIAPDAFAHAASLRPVFRRRVPPFG
jgi:hypothetical protein